MDMIQEKDGLFMNHDISIVGMSIKVPNADNIEQLWDIMKNKEVCI